jgi:hypothetical protein
VNCITLTLWRRPDYTRQCLDALSRCAGIENYTILIGINPDPETLVELRGIAESISFAREVVVAVRPSNIGCNANKYWLLDKAFQFSDYVIQLEDDNIFAPDALRYFEWAKQFGNDPRNLTVAAWRNPTGWLPGTSTKPEGEDSAVSRHAHFTCYGWAIWKDRWDEIKTSWPMGMDYPWWDETLCYKTRGDRLELSPNVSRAINIGVNNGMHPGTDKTFPYWAGIDGFAQQQDFHLTDSIAPHDGKIG